ncbi:MAG TPA: AzlD domain-containing protein [Xanthobacteraceae bacterium]|nr:AzlD domain-containing protein [Xanthobacteraceae bacterium]
MVSDASALVAVLLLMLVTIATRLTGVWIMSYVRITPRIEAFLKYMAAGVLIAIVVPNTLSASPRIWIAVVAAAAVMIATRSALAAMLIGTALAAAGRWVGT